MRPGTLEIQLIEGHGLKNTDVFGKSDPYAIICIKDQQLKSTIVKGGGSDPKWNQTFHFTINEEVTEMIIKLFDKDSANDDDAMGTVKIPLKKVLHEQQEVPVSIYDVLSPDGKSHHGKLTVGLKFVPVPKESDSEGDRFHLFHHHRDIGGGSHGEQS